MRQSIPVQSLVTERFEFQIHRAKVLLVPADTSVSAAEQSSRMVKKIARGQIIA